MPLRGSFHPTATCLPSSWARDFNQQKCGAAARLRGGPWAAAAAGLAETAAVSTLLRLLIYLIIPKSVMTAFAYDTACACMDLRICETAPVDQQYKLRLHYIYTSQDDRNANRTCTVRQCSLPYVTVDGPYRSANSGPTYVGGRLLDGGSVDGVARGGDWSWLRGGGWIRFAGSGGVALPLHPPGSIGPLYLRSAYTDQVAGGPPTCRPTGRGTTGAEGPGGSTSTPTEGTCATRAAVPHVHVVPLSPQMHVPAVRTSGAVPLACTLAAPTASWAATIAQMARTAAQSTCRRGGAIFNVEQCSVPPF